MVSLAMKSSQTIPKGKYIRRACVKHATFLEAKREKGHPSFVPWEKELSSLMILKLLWFRTRLLLLA